MDSVSSYCACTTFDIGGSADVSGTLTEQWELVAATCDEARVEPGGRAGSRWKGVTTTLACVKVPICSYIYIYMYIYT